MKRFALYGANGFGREMMPVARQHVALTHPGDAVEFVFVDDDPALNGRLINGHPCLSFEELIRGDREATRISVTIAAPRVREGLVRKCEQHGLAFFEILAGNHIRQAHNEIGEGAVFCSHTLVTTNAQIGRHFHCNAYSYVSHDCVIGDFVTFGLRVSCNGRVVIEDGAYIGTGAMLKQGTHEKPLVVGAGATVGMGAVVIRDVPPGEVVVGNPARRLTKG